MKGVLLCGGEGTRLRPLTEVVNKHLIRVVDKPMSEYPLLKMIEAGIDDFLIVSGGSNFAGVVKYFGSGSKWNVNIVHAIQDQAGGIAEALSLAESFVGKNKVLVVLGDNFWTMDLKPHIDRFKEIMDDGGMFFSTTVKEPQHYGVLEFDEDGDAIDIHEKPKNPPSDQALAGIYAYTHEVFDVIKHIEPSARGELEISSVNQVYLTQKYADIVPLEGSWFDCGQFETLLEVERHLLNDRSI